MTLPATVDEQAFLDTLDHETRALLAQRLVVKEEPPPPLALVPEREKKPRPKRAIPAPIGQSLVELVRLSAFGTQSFAFHNEVQKLVAKLEAAGDEGTCAGLRAVLSDRQRRTERKAAEGIEWREPDVAPRDPLVLGPKALARYEQIVRECACRDAFAARGIDPPTRMLFDGPPGTGKTLAAHWIAHRLGLPIAISRIDGIVGKYLGDMPRAFRQIVDAVSQQPSVLFLDEMDAILVSRSQSSDGAGASQERISGMLSFLQMLDGLDPCQIVIGATNCPESIDDAMLSRFGDRMTFEEPTVHARMRMVIGWLANVEVTDEEIAALVSESQRLHESGRELRQRAMRLGRRAVLRAGIERKAREEEGRGEP